MYKIVLAITLMLFSVPVLAHGCGHNHAKSPGFHGPGLPGCSPGIPGQTSGCH